MKILIDARLYGLENAGLGRYAVNLIDELSKLDHDNNYVILLREKYHTSLQLPKNFKKIAKIIVPSNFVKEDIVKTYKTSQEKVIVTYEGVNLPNVSKNTNDSEVLKKYGLSANNYFLYIGSAYPHKNLKRAIEAAIH